MSSDLRIVRKYLYFFIDLCSNSNKSRYKGSAVIVLSSILQKTCWLEVSKTAQIEPLCDLHVILLVLSVDSCEPLEVYL